MYDTRSHSLLNNCTVLTLDGTHLERVTSYKYLDIWLDNKFIFAVHMDSLLKKISPKYFFASIRLWLCNLYASSSLLKKLDVIYHAALWFITDASVCTHHCKQYEWVQWPMVHCV